jgi:tRNA uridine 5-carbamoylmethylation protein Kti12
MSQTQSPSAPGPIYFITGCPGVGKTTTAIELAQRFEKAIHFNIDYFRAMVISGVAHPIPTVTKETQRQFALAHTAVGKAAKVYSDAGFAVIAEHCTFPDNYHLFLAEAPTAKVLCLHADAQTNHQRNQERTERSFDPNDLNQAIDSMAEMLYTHYEKLGYPTYNNTHKDVEDAVEIILKL